MIDNIKLSETNEVYRNGDTVLRPYDEFTPSIHSLLQHFYDNNLPVPKIIRPNDNGYEIQEFIDGVMIHPNKWSDESLADIAKLVSEMHKVSKTYIPPANFKWRPWYLRELGGDNIIYSHGDFAPWNIITDGVHPIGVVDWEFAGAIDAITELARVCWLFVQLVDDDLGVLYDLPSPEKRAEQVRMMVDIYGLTIEQRYTFLDRIIETIICETAHEAIDPKLTFDSHGSLWGFAWRTRSLYWIWRNRDILNHYLW